MQKIYDYIDIFINSSIGYFINIPSMRQGKVKKDGISSLQKALSRISKGK